MATGSSIIGRNLGNITNKKNKTLSVVSSGRIVIKIFEIIMDACGCVSNIRVIRIGFNYLKSLDGLPFNERLQGTFEHGVGNNDVSNRLIHYQLIAMIEGFVID